MPLDRPKDVETQFSEEDIGKSVEQLVEEGKIRPERFGWDEEQLRQLSAVRYDDQARREVDRAIRDGRVPSEFTEDPAVRRKKRD